MRGRPAAAGRGVVLRPQRQEGCGRLLDGSTCCSAALIMSVAGSEASTSAFSTFWRALLLMMRQRGADRKVYRSTPPNDFTIRLPGGERTRSRTCYPYQKAYHDPESKTAAARPQIQRVIISAQQAPQRRLCMQPAHAHSPSLPAVPVFLQPIARRAPPSSRPTCRCPACTSGG